MRRLAPLVFVVLLVAILAALLFPAPAPTSGDVADAGLGASQVYAAPADQAVNPGCWPRGIPLGALPGQPESIWCYNPPEFGPPTYVNGTNSWLDDFEHGLSLAKLNPGYRIFEQFGDGQSIVESQHWRHNNHWMVDVRGRNEPGAESNWGGTLMRPDRGFRAVGGKLVVEADVAAGIEEYGGSAWPEIAISTAPSPSPVAADILYGYGQFQGAWTVGCRLPPQRTPICALLGPASSDARIWEVASHISAGAQIYAGGPWNAELDRAWRVCRGTDPDTNCRDRFRLEVTRTSLTVYVNGVRYFEASNFPAGERMDALIDSNVYAYFASWLYRPNADTVRFHWDHIAVNPGTPPSAAPGFGGTSPTPTRTATPVRTATPTAVPARTPTPTSAPTKTCVLVTFIGGVETSRQPWPCP